MAALPEDPGFYFQQPHGRSQPPRESLSSKLGKLYLNKVGSFVSLL